MPRSYRLFVVAAIGCLIVAAAIGLALQPQQPNLSGDRGHSEQAAQYRAGGSKCEPAKIERLSGRQRLRRADACAEAEEQHREATDGVIQSRRAADAADAQAIAAYQQTRIAAWGFGAGIVTLFAAIAAALFAERAASHTKDANRITEEAARPWLDFELSIVNAHITHNSIYFTTSINVSNIGQRVAPFIFLNERIRKLSPSDDQPDILQIGPPDDDFFKSCDKKDIFRYHLPGSNIYIGMTTNDVSLDSINHRIVGGFHIISICLDCVVFYEWADQIRHTGKTLNLVALRDGKALTHLPPAGTSQPVDIQIIDAGYNHVT